MKYLAPIHSKSKRCTTQASEKGEATLYHGVPECLGKGRGARGNNFVATEIQCRQGRIETAKCTSLERNRDETELCSLLAINE